MPLRATATETTERVWKGRIDARWTMAYAAGIRRSDDQYFDTSASTGVVAHPLFPVAPEWQLLTDRASQVDVGLTAAEAARGVHASHDLVLHRPIRANQSVEVTAEVAGVERKSAGALMTMRLDGSGDDGPLWTTWMRSLYRGVDVDGADVLPEGAPDPVVRPDGLGEPLAIDQLELWRGEAHVYTECARIWNPIHTDVQVASAAGLPDIILHGTATLAHGTSFVLDVLKADASATRRVGGSFRAMVELPSTIERRVQRVDELADGRRLAHFEVRTESGEVAVRDGFVVVDRSGRD